MGAGEIPGTPRDELVGPHRCEIFYKGGGSAPEAQRYRCADVFGVLPSEVPGQQSHVHGLEYVYVYTVSVEVYQTGLCSGLGVLPRFPRDHIQLGRSSYAHFLRSKENYHRPSPFSEQRGSEKTGLQNSGFSAKTKKKKLNS